MAKAHVQLLDKHTAELIAAGEVVERPSSVVKELVENSIDAGSRAITVEIKSGGVSYIRITDDGEGITHDEVPTAFLRHATSKIKTGDDLISIATLGFRGEALASICAVSRVELITRTADEEIGTHYVIEGGDEKEFDECGCAVGTTIIIRDIFYNTPARMKFLKKDVAEGNAVASLIDRIALSHPEVSIRFIRDGKQVLMTSGDGQLKSAIYSVLGRDFTVGLMPVSYTLNNVKVTGFTSKPAHSRPNTTMQIFFINGRYCKSRTMQAAIEEAYKGAIMVGKHPACVLGLQIDCSAVDVNVHPAKLEVRFTNEKPVFEAIYYAVKSALADSDTRSQLTIKNTGAQRDNAMYAPPVRQTGEQSSILAGLPKQGVKSTDYTHNAPKNDSRAAPAAAGAVPQAAPQPVPTTQKAPTSAQTSVTPERQETSQRITLRDSGDYLIGAEQKPYPFSPVTKTTSQNNRLLWENISQHDSVQNQPRVIEESPVCVPADVGSTPAEATKPFDLPDYRIVGEAFMTYIVVETGDKLVLIDKHAAHERLIYEQLINSGSGRDPQLLLEPVAVTLDRAEYEAMLDNRQLLSDAGFEIDDFGSGTILVRAVPTVMGGAGISDTIMEIAAGLGTRVNAVMTERLYNMYHTIACRAAIKAHDVSREPELAALVMELIHNPAVRYCPHGRPIYIELTKRELEKSFGRVQ